MQPYLAMPKGARPTAVPATVKGLPFNYGVANRVQIVYFENMPIYNRTDDRRYTNAFTVLLIVRAKGPNDPFIIKFFAEGPSAVRTKRLTAPIHHLEFSANTGAIRLFTAGYCRTPGVCIG